jgi:formamidopyrimidine-DNA glycosylase
MPELPEVETIKNDLAKKIIGKRIERVDVNLARAVRNSRGKFINELTGNKFTAIRRVGKLMIFVLGSKDKYLLTHLKMTGQLIYCGKNLVIAGGHSLPAGQKGLAKLQGCLPNKYSRVVIHFADRSALFFNDMRTFGYLEIVHEAGLDQAMKKFGPDSLHADITAGYLEKLFHNRTAPIKALLLDQKNVAGIGNIYADEILFAAGVRPDRRAGTLSRSETAKIARAIKSVINKAVKYRGTTFNDYVDSEGRTGNFAKMLKVYGRAGEPCPRCPGEVIRKNKIAGRGTHFCPHCQI